MWDVSRRIFDVGIIDRIKGFALRYEDYIRQIRLAGEATFAICLIARNNCAHRRLIIN